MPKKKEADPQEAQSERFRQAVRAAVAAGELNPTEADERFELILARMGNRGSGEKESS